MNLLVIGDTHGKTDFSYLLGMAKQADVIVHVGDFTDYGQDPSLCIEGLRSLARASECKVIFTHGNHDNPQIRELVKNDDACMYIHQSVWVHQEVAFFGYGGGGFGDVEPSVEQFFSAAYSDHCDTGSIHVWVFHGPPFDTEIDFRPGWGPTGSRTKRELIDVHKPHFVLAGHIHEAWGTIHQIDETVLVNPGPDGVLLEIDITQK